MLLQFPLAMFSQVTSNIIEALVSIKRLQTFFAADELQGDARELVATKRRLEAGDEVLAVRDGEFAWSKDALNPTLEGINLAVKKGELVELAVENERRVGVNSGGYVPQSLFKRKHTHTPLEWTKPHPSSPSPSPPSSSTSSRS